MPTKKILFATDFSENSAPARERAIEYAKALGAELLIIHVVNSRLLGYPHFAETAPFDLAVIEKNIQEAVEEELQAISEQISVEVKRVTTYHVAGTPSEEIVRFADEYDVDLIAMGTHGWTGFKHLIVGSTAENVVRSARCPVLTVRPRG
jgi:universal stress protein A